MISNAFTVSREVELDYAEQGYRIGPPIILLHGFTDSRRSFDRLMARLPRSIHTIAVSLRGHGDSVRPREGYEPRDFAADIVALMDRLEFRDAVIVGHSMGATVAQRFAIDFPERTRGVVLEGSFFTAQDHVGVQEFWDSTVSRLEDPIDPAIVRDFQLSTIAQALPEVFLETVIRESLKVPARTWKAALRALMESNFTQELRHVRAPTMLVWGDKDAFAGRSDQDRLLAAIPDAHLKVYEGVGHSPHWEDPGRFAGDVVDFALTLM
jgi:non-heme chloroperoxidase